MTTWQGPVRAEVDARPAAKRARARDYVLDIVIPVSTRNATFRPASVVCTTSCNRGALSGPDHGGDNASTDGTLAVARQLARELPVRRRDHSTPRAAAAHAGSVDVVDGDRRAYMDV